MGHTAYISIGSNLGDRLENCKKALDILDCLEGISVLGVSRWYESEAETVDGESLPDEPAYINGAAEIRTSLEPAGLLARMLETEERLGRPRERKKGARRTVDLDLLLFGDELKNTPKLILPHPALAKRLFVLRPLCDIAPDALEPASGKTAETLLREALARGGLDRIEEYRGVGRKDGCSD